MKVNDLSEKIVISTGRIVSWPCVRALNSLQKAMMLMPCGPSAVPTGGAGLAFPAGIWSFTKPETFLAITLLDAYAGRCAARSNYHCCFTVAVVCDVTAGAGRSRSVALQLQVIQFHRRRPPEQRDRHPHLPFV